MLRRWGKQYRLIREAVGVGISFGEQPDNGLSLFFLSFWAAKNLHWWPRRRKRNFTACAWDISFYETCVFLSVSGTTCFWTDLIDSSCPKWYRKRITGPTKLTRARSVRTPAASWTCSCSAERRMVSSPISDPLTGTPYSTDTGRCPRGNYCWKWRRSLSPDCRCMMCWQWSRTAKDRLGWKLWGKVRRVLQSHFSFPHVMYLL